MARLPTCFYSSIALMQRNVKVVEKKELKMRVYYKFSSFYLRGIFSRFLNNNNNRIVEIFIPSIEQTKLMKFILFPPKNNKVL